MFAQLGEIEFELITYFNGIDETVSYNYAEHERISNKPVLQFMGMNLQEQNIKLNFHNSFCVPEDEIKKLKDSIYQIMEYVEGDTLQTIIRKKNLLTEARTICVLKDISLALDMLHQNQVIHRDVKPGNIFVTPDWMCKLGDLGISRRLIDRTATTTGHVVGTPGYISPEQVLDIRPLDIRTDIYSLGLTLFHAITGGNPYTKETPYESMLARLQGPEAELDEHNSKHISRDLRTVINCMFRRRAAERYPTPLAILSDLEKYGLFASQEPTGPSFEKPRPEESQQDS